MNGGRKKWLSEGRELSKETPSVPRIAYRAKQPDFPLRAYLPQVQQASAARSAAIVDVRSPQEFTGEILAPPGLPETCQRAAMCLVPAAFPGERPATTTAPSNPATNSAGSTVGMAWTDPGRLSLIAALVSGPVTLGLCSNTCLGSITSPTTTAPGRSGAICARRNRCGRQHSEGLIVKAENFQERQVEVAGWPVNLTTYRLGTEWHAKADNVSPGAALSRTTGATREEAEQAALKRAGELLSRTRRHAV